MISGVKTRVERTQGSIISAAADLFLKHGFLGTNMDEIAATAKVSKQTVYAHFQGKEALFLEIVRGMTGEAGDELQEQVADPEPDLPIEHFLLDFADRQLSIVMTPRLMQLRRLVIGEAERFPELGKALHERGPGRSIGRLAKAFARYQERGQIKAHDVHAAASFFNWLVMGAPVNDAMLLGNGAIPQPDALQAHAREAVRIFLAAYCIDDSA
ncbi:TetR family transcriptional regulator [Phyllobacterium brassicacearum]|uniref:TetR family transcriptional regulator n=1 Tax=Phyllobacterium brassicacearum TaxID=314235 RepID=A0A2P7B825_9HYPH|nr:TetR/AcrR family transcriptional regulator [Phyllobacterium brassicacearum]PSH62621.1 TetR family transcriptional regulator [Phyllobacterium brassicacearum]TDQ09195.1 TetR family transcriptional regulator [Phyllobacterium brassicacearum]